MLVLREFASRVRVVVGRRAKSAATLFAIGADEIYMGPLGELGPLDAQLFVKESGPGTEDRQLGALDIANASDLLARKALAIALEFGGYVHELTSIPRGDVLPSMLTFAADHMRPVMSKLEPSDVYRAQRLLEVARDYGERLLRRRADPLDAQAAHNLAHRLVTDYHEHGFVIDRHEARQLGLPIESLSEYEDIDAYEASVPVLDHIGHSTFKIIDPAEFLKDVPSDDDGLEDAQDDVDEAANDSSTSPDHADEPGAATDDA